MSTYGYLAHHGINGQKWGVRNGPPYPLKPGMHSAAEKKKNNNHYSQGVKQNRGGSSTKTRSYSGSRERTKEEELALLEKREKAKKIMKGVAIGAGVTAATAAIAALTVGGVATYAGVKEMKKNPETTKAILSNIGSSLLSGLKSSREMSEGMKDINKITDANEKKAATDLLRNTVKANRADEKQARADKLWAAKFLDNTSKGNDKREYMKLATDPTTKFGRDQMMKDARLMKGQEEKIFNMTPIKEYKDGKPVYYKEGELLQEMTTNASRINKARNMSNSAQRDYNEKHGLKGTINKVNKTAEGVKSVIGKGKNIYGAGAAVVGLGTAAKRAIDNKTSGGNQNDEYYYDQYGNRRKKNPNQQNNQQRRY